ncbi:hypothetical protein [Nitratireductor sp. XY-223]|uniref:hypothetical protein n=1 Tax=Nitratireductor sp. XY-223 TaxID=2561926 RepID=UPI0010A9BD14|nr:hypothetical protein [Nitratireductor sp. XY-223]
MSEEISLNSGKGYQSNLRRRLKDDLDAVINDGASAGEFIDFVISENYASYKRGVEFGREFGKGTGSRRGRYNKRGRKD